MIQNSTLSLKISMNKQEKRLKRRFYYFNHYLYFFSNSVVSIPKVFNG